MAMTALKTVAIRTCLEGTCHVQGVTRMQCVCIWMGVCLDVGVHMSTHTDVHLGGRGSRAGPSISVQNAYLVAPQLRLRCEYTDRVCYGRVVEGGFLQ
jgi:hypothetical protein